MRNKKENEYNIRSHINYKSYRKHSVNKSWVKGGATIIKDLYQQISSYSSTPEHVDHGKQGCLPKL